MKLSDISNPEERKKLIWAIVLGLFAIVFLWWALFGIGPSPKPTVKKANSNSNPGPGPRRVGETTTAQTVNEIKSAPLEQLRPIVFSDFVPSAPEAKRNIFVYYEKPPPAPKSETGPTPTPTPPPPLLLAGIQPSNRFARTEDFTMEVTGDKFVPGVRIVVDGRELTTRFISPQQLSATVPASLVANPGARSVMVKSPDGSLYSTTLSLNVSAPPTPNYSYVGIIGTRRFIDTAILQDKNNREILNVQRGDVLAGRFRLTSISEKELVLVDTQLNIKHTLPFSTDRDRATGPQSRPTPRVEAEDDEP
ncbi:MAG TPA: hypothetical protein VFV61_07175 [Pyrinomonadaceae bacterium]|jgi:hypothetical protein|nr:hypothetical protein [Pyrinomonadaceae bacterium]